MQRAPRGPLAGLAFGLWLCSVAAAQNFSNHVELRVYTTHPDSRDRFLEYFEEHYLESQEVLGMRIWGQFRDLREPTHFVWIRGFDSMATRLDGLRTFYTSPMWQETGGEVGTMLAARGRVRLLEPVTADTRFARTLGRPALLSEAGDDPRGVIVGLVFGAGHGRGGAPPTAAGALENLTRRVQEQLLPVAAEAGAISLGLFRTSGEQNNFPALPVTETDPVVVWFASFASQEAYRRFEASAAVADGPQIARAWVLEPGRRSRLVHRSAAASPGR